VQETPSDTTEKAVDEGQADIASAADEAPAVEGEAPPVPEPPTNAALLLMLQELRQEFESYKTQTAEKMANERIQLKNAQRAHSQQCSRETTELRAICDQQAEIIVTLQNKCHGLEKQLKQKREGPQKNASPASAGSATSSPSRSVATSQVPKETRYANGCSQTSPLPSLSDSNPVNHATRALLPLPTPRPIGQDNAVMNDEAVSTYNNANGGSAPRGPSVRLATSATKLLIGDSNMRRINMKRLNREGEIQVKTISGARISTLQQAIAGMSTTKAIKKLVLHAGTNNIAGRRRETDSVAQCVEQYVSLLDTARSKMPDAKIAVCAVPPLKPWGLCKAVRQLNGELRDLCRKRGVAFLSHEALWQVDDYGKLDPDILTDDVHFSQLGLGLYLRETKEFLVGARTTGGGHKKDKTREDKAARHAITDSSIARGSYADVVAERQRAPRDDRDTARPPVTSELRTDPPSHPTNGSHWVRSPPSSRGQATRYHGESQGTGDYYSAYHPPGRGSPALNVRDAAPQTPYSPDSYDRYNDGASYSGWAPYPEFQARGDRADHSQQWPVYPETYYGYYGQDWYYYDQQRAPSRRR
jgi:hypothetical protein